MNDKRNALWVLVGMIVMAALFMFIGFMAGKAKYDKPLVETVTRDTVIVVDTAYYDRPVAKDSVRTRYVTRWLPAKHDTINNTVTMWAHDTVAVEVPITSKHYNADTYDAWVSGFEPSLDSIRVYQRTEYITETITKVIKDSKHFFLDVGAGCEYKFNEKTTIPFAELGLSFKMGKFGAGAYGGYAHDVNENKAAPYGKIKLSYDIISF